MSNQGSNRNVRPERAISEANQGSNRRVRPETATSATNQGSNRNVRQRRASDNDNNTAVFLSDPEFRVIRIQFEKDRPSYNRIDTLRQEYCKFLSLKVAETPATSDLLAPSYLIDKLWHAHILSTREYHAFCRRHNGGNYLHHDPTMNRGQSRYNRTISAYQQRYGHRPFDREIWPDSVDAMPRPQAVTSNNNRSAAAENGERPDPVNSNNVHDAATESSDNNDDEDGDGNYGDYAEDNDSIHNFLDTYGDERGRTVEELTEWHRQWQLNDNDECSRDEDRATCCAQCPWGHCWGQGDFDLRCDDCRSGAKTLNSFSCG